MTTEIAASVGLALVAGGVPGWWLKRRIGDCCTHDTESIPRLVTGTTREWYVFCGPVGDDETLEALEAQIREGREAWACHHSPAWTLYRVKIALRGKGTPVLAPPAELVRAYGKPKRIPEPLGEGA